MSFVLKITCNGETYRLTLHEEPTYDSVSRAVAALRPDLAPQSVSAPLESCAKYEDEDGDLCTLAPQTFDDFLEQQAARTSGAQRVRVLKLQLMPPREALLGPTKDGHGGQPAERRAEPLWKGKCGSCPKLQAGLAEGWAGDCQGGQRVCDGGPKPAGRCGPARGCPVDPGDAGFPGLAGASSLGPALCPGGGQDQRCGQERPQGCVAPVSRGHGCSHCGHPWLGPRGSHCGHRLPGPRGSGIGDGDCVLGRRGLA
mmetsp:Transcript_20369/g.63651  ORF Transcript_20369/g.63651 Transcript_20369/m.63651 type:complete len:256 (+) Transcript_20369:90-857(+)